MKTSPPRRWHLAIVTALLALSIAACERAPRTITPEQAQPFVTAWADGVGDALKERAEQAASSEALAEALAKGREQEQANTNRKEPPYYELAERAYEAREGKLALVHHGELTARGVSVLELLKRVEEDGFDPAPYRIDRVEQRLEELKAKQAKLAALQEFAPGESEREAALRYLTALKPEEFALTPDQHNTLTEALIKAEGGQGLRDYQARLEQLNQDAARLSAEVEATLAVGLLRYARNMKFFRIKEIFIHERHDDRYNDPETRGKRPIDAHAAYVAGTMWRRAAFTATDIAKKSPAQVMRDQLESFFTQALSAEDIKPALTTLSPGPQYDGIKQAAVRYRALVASGGWESVAEQKLKLGSQGAGVRALKVRLQREGYLAADAKLDDRFDAALTEAVKAYQETHQMKVTGEPDRSFWRSVNVPAERRLAQLMLNLKRWRESNVRHHEDPVYALVNLPDFHAEIWKDQALQMRMRVVVGNNDSKIDEATRERVTPNRTPTVSAYIDRAIYNPFWNVTPRIREEETLVDVRKDLEKRYQAKLDNMLGGARPSPATPSASPTGLEASPALGQPPAPAPAIAPSARLTRPGGKDGLIFDVEGIRSAYLTRHGAEADLKALLPYLNVETGRVDVSTTDPNNIPPWYEANGYEPMHPGTKWEYVRQLNGDDNSLGRVKIIFANLHDIYLHDTNAKALFNNEIRAYSHGCLRMHKPLDFARWLLENDGSYDEAAISKALKETIYTPVFLKKRVPVHVEYFTVRADEQGRPHFLIDIYSRDPS